MDIRDRNKGAYQPSRQPMFRSADALRPQQGHDGMPAQVEIQPPTPQPAQTPAPEPQERSFEPPADFRPAAAAVPKPTNGHPKPSKKKIIIDMLVILALVGILGFFAVNYFASSVKLHTAKSDLAYSQTQLINAQKVLIEKKNTEDFIAKYNDVNLSKSLCAGKAVGMFDVHLNDKFAVFHYLCAEQSNPIRIGALKKLANGTYEFTYGSTTAKPNNLPSYIYDTDPDFFSQTYGSTKF